MSAAAEPIRPKRRLPGVPHAQLALADEVARFETNALPDEVQRYLRAVDTYRAAGYPPHWRPEGVNEG